MTSHPGATTWAYIDLDGSSGTGTFRPDLNRLARASLSVAYLWAYVAREVLRYHGLPQGRASEYNEAIQGLARSANQQGGEPA